MSNFSIPDKLNSAQLPTPIQHLPRLSEQASRFGEVKLYVKRDDLTHGPATGNKIRKLEFLLAEALRKKARVIFTCGGIQSNHARATAILCRELGLECVLFLRGSRPGPDEPLEGNLLLDGLCGAKTVFVTPQEYGQMPKLFFAASEPYRKRDGVMPFFIPEGGSNDIGAMGYFMAFNEILSQSGKDGLPTRFSSIVTASGSGGTHAGLLLGRNLSEWQDDCRVVSFNVCGDAKGMAERVKHVMISAIQRHHMPVSFMPMDVHIVDGYVGPGYAKAAPELYDFIVNTAREDGLILDPVYTGKALFGLLSELQSTPERAALFGNRVLFVHTGGLPSLFAHSASLTEAIHRREGVS